jgi:hypothetical protein
MATPAEIRRELNAEIDRYLHAVGGSDAAKRSAARIVEAVIDHPWLADQVPDDVWAMARRDVIQEGGRQLKRILEKRTKQERKPSRVTVREGEYRGVAGYLITASYDRGFPPSRIFVRRKTSADQIREALKRDDQEAVDRIIRSEGSAARQG